MLLYHRQQNMFDKINAVTDCRSKTGRNRNDDFLVRGSIDHIAAVANRGVNTFLRMYDPLEIAVKHAAESAAFDHARRKHFPKPFRGNDLLPVPCAVLQTELTELCHVSSA